MFRFVFRIQSKKERERLMVALDVWKEMEFSFSLGTNLPIVIQIKDCLQFEQPRIRSKSSQDFRLTARPSTPFERGSGGGVFCCVLRELHPSDKFGQFPRDILEQLNSDCFGINQNFFKSRFFVYFQILLFVS